MKTALSAISAKGNSIGCHGFAFLWKDEWDLSLAPYSISLFNVAAFNRLDRFVFELQDGEQLIDIQERFVWIVSEFSPEGHGGALQEITCEGERFLKHFSSPTMEGFTTWPALKQIMDGRANYVSFVAWGFFEELLLDRVREKYDAKDRVGFDSPFTGLELIQDLIDGSVQSIDLSYYFYDPDEEEETKSWVSIGMQVPVGLNATRWRSLRQFRDLFAKPIKRSVRQVGSD